MKTLHIVVRFTFFNRFLFGSVTRQGILCSWQEFIGLHFAYTTSQKKLLKAILTTLQANEVVW